MNSCYGESGPFGLAETLRLLHDPINVGWLLLKCGAGKPMMRS